MCSCCICLCINVSGYVFPYQYVLTTVSHCSKGQRVAIEATHCEPCPNGYFQPTENESKQCLVCTKCVKGTSNKINIKHFELRC